MYPKGIINAFWGSSATPDKVGIDLLEGLSIIESVKRITEPFKNANRQFHGEDSVLDISGRKIGGGHFLMIAGPCSRGKRRADHLRGQPGEGRRRGPAAGRRVQSPAPRPMIFRGSTGTACGF